jgi:kynurenine formamidase
MIVDLTQTIKYDMHVFDANARPLTIPWAKMDIHGYESELIFMSTHTGTHMDAPYHFHLSGNKIDEIAPERYVADAVLLRIRKGAREYIRRSDIERCERRGAEIKKGSSIIISTGWESHLSKDDYLQNNPGLSKDAALYLASKRVNMVGVDTANVDHPSDTNFSVHKILLPKNVLIVENLCNLKNMKGSFRLIVLPLKIKGASGSPVRALAVT